jgi:6,7-dimethyl-8-ribityllumazine synthase
LIICFWVVVRWGTTHYEHVAWECFRGLMNLSIASDICLINWVLTCENNMQVEERTSATYAISWLNLLEMRKKIQ